MSDQPAPTPTREQAAANARAYRQDAAQNPRPDAHYTEFCDALADLIERGYVIYKGNGMLQATELGMSEMRGVSP